MGESRFAGERILFYEPLAVLFEVREEDYTVIVKVVRRSRYWP